MRIYTTEEAKERNKYSRQLCDRKRREKAKQTLEIYGTITNKLETILGYIPDKFAEAHRDIEQVEEMKERGIIDEEEEVVWFNKLKVKYEKNNK